jgi:tetratricopeptide (TPR) repeat protein
VHELRHAPGRAVAPWLVLFALALAAHAVARSNPFVFDDVDAIVENPHVRALWPLQQALEAPAGSGASGRPLVALSLAIDHALFGFDAAGWHLVNIGFLVLSAGVLYVLCRDTLRLPRYADRFASRAGGIALAAASIWVVHPLHSAVIDHVVYRNELMAGLCILLVLLGVLRTARGKTPRRWGSMAVLASAAGMASKETAAAAPILALMYDSLFIAGGVRAALARRRTLYIGLAATWIVLVACVASGDRGASVTERYADVSRVDYARTQLGVVAHYLRLAFWPRPLVLDYDWPIASRWEEVALPAAVVLGLVVATVWALRKRSGLGFLGAAFFLILAPSSSFIPLTGAVAAEHRMSMPLTALVVCVVLGGDAVLGRLRTARARKWAGAAATGIAVLWLGVLAVSRHRDFATTVSIWRKTATDAPQNPRAHGNLGAALLASGDVAGSIEPLETALRLQPEFQAAQSNLAAAHRTLGLQQAARGASDAAAVHLRRALEQDESDVQTMNALAWVLATSPDDTVRDAETALDLARRALAGAPASHEAEILDTLAAAHADAGEFETAVEVARRAETIAAHRGDEVRASRHPAPVAMYASHRPYRANQR